MIDEFKKVLGTGAQATVYYQDGFAYKVFREGYPQDWINYERSIMRAVAKTGMAMPHCYEYEEQNIIKMDYIEGITLADRIQKLKYKTGVEDLIALQKSIHQHECSGIPDFKTCSQHDLQDIGGFEREKKVVLRYLDEIEVKSCLLHLDFHFLNVMYTNDNYAIIDWVNAKTGNPIYDFARTYVILNESAYRISRTYLNLLKKDKTIDLADLKKAILVMALLRLREFDTEKTRGLIQEYFTVGGTRES